MSKFKYNEIALIKKTLDLVIIKRYVFKSQSYFCSFVSPTARKKHRENQLNKVIFHLSNETGAKEFDVKPTKLDTKLIELHQNAIEKIEMTFDFWLKSNLKYYFKKMLRKPLPYRNEFITLQHRKFVINHKIAVYKTKIESIKKDKFDMYLLIKKYELKNICRCTGKEWKLYNYISANIGFKYKRSELIQLKNGMNYFEM